MILEAAVFFSMFTVPLVSTQGLTNEELDEFESYGIEITREFSGDFWLFEHSGLPDHTYGPFPNQDNPNSAAIRDHDYLIPKKPNWLDTPGCLPMGTIGMSKSGIPFYNPYTGAGDNAIENEVFDDCDGHPDPSSTYHYHQLPSCLYENRNNELMGVALDGYPIFGPKDENGKILTTDDLDFCHGRWFNGRYQYHITYDFPYVMSCFRGEATAQERPMYGNGTGPVPPGDGPPPVGGEERPPPGFGGEGNRPPPLDGEGAPPPEGMGWPACFAYCENPGRRESTCVEPEYMPGLHDSRPNYTSGATSFVLTGILGLTGCAMSNIIKLWF